MAGMMSNLMDKLHLSKSKEEPPKEPDKEELRKLRKKFEEAKQDHVFWYYDDLDVAGKASLFAQLSQIEPQHVNDITDKALKTSDTQEKPDLQPLPEHASCSLIGAPKEDLDQWYSHGLQLVAENKVGVVLMAGGQGTRLGSSAPKGCYKIGLPSEKSLFQLQAERIIKIQQLAAHNHGKDEVVVPWYVMTSGPTRKPTQDFFEKHEHFGLKKENVVFFEQGILPCVSNEGKILLEDKAKVGHDNPILGADRMKLTLLVTDRDST